MQCDMLQNVNTNDVCSDMLQNVNTNVICHASIINNDTSLHHNSTLSVAQETVNDNSVFNTQSYYIFIYSICFSTIKGGNFWNYQTENAIVEHAIQLF